MFKLFSFNKQDLENIKKLQSSKVTSRKVIGRSTLVADASEIRKTKTFQENAKRASELATKKAKRL